MAIAPQSMADMSPELLRAHKTFHPHAFRRQKQVASEKSRFVHYTGINAAIGILSSKSIWLRSVDCMNDYLEVDYGLERLSAACASPSGERLKAKLEEAQSGFWDEFAGLFDGWSQRFRRHTYIFCMSEHEPSEDRLGRLSMWRAYGNDTRLAIVIKSDPFLQVHDVLGAYSSPVEYLGEENYLQAFDGVVKSIEANFDFVQSLSRGHLKHCLFDAFKFAALCTKHPGFAEEREWRIIYTPELEHSEHLIKNIQVVNGVPQTIYRIPLKNIPEAGLVGIEIPEVLDRVIVGPTDHGVATYDALVHLLSEAGVSEPEKKVFVSDIPLR